MKAMSAGVTFSAAMVRSPSFSRSSSSHTITMRPARMSSSASSMVANGRSANPLLHEPLHVLGDHVHFNVDSVAYVFEPQCGHLSRMGDKRDAEAARIGVHHRQAHTVQRHKTFGHDVAQDIRTGADAHSPLNAFGPDVDDRRRAVNVTLDEMPTQSGRQGHAPLQAYAIARFERA